jgi:transposase
MESTGSYWKPVLNILEDRFTIVLANPVEVKCRKGHKTDWKDSQWLAHLLRHAMLRSSFIPPRPVRELRDLTRRRKQMIRNVVQEKNRVLKTLEEGNVKLDNVLSDVFGLSGQAMLHALLQERHDAAEIAKLARGRAKSKRLELTASLEGSRLTGSQRSVIRHCLRHLDFLVEEIQALDAEIRDKLHAIGFAEKAKLLATIPGIQESTAASVLAEVGGEMTQFPDSAHLSSWAGLCPGNNVSAGVHGSCRTTKGNRWLRDTITEAAWAGCRKKGSSLWRKYHRLAARRGKKRAIIAAAHTLLVIIYHVLLEGIPYQRTLDEEALAEAKRSRIRYHLRSLATLGVSLDPILATGPATVAVT